MVESRRSAKRLRCAIYTRKSSEEGLEQAFNSLDAQREACAAFILSQKHEGWTVLPTLYDDGGFSGGTMDRPALKLLLSDIAEGRVDVVVVYKIDRLTRSLFDFAKIVEAFEAKGVSFVSITQQFNTSTSMGRLTLNVLLSFAQFERELAGERIRDKIAASKKKGMWMGGLPPLGYDVKDRKLVVNDDGGAYRPPYLQALSRAQISARSQDRTRRSRNPEQAADIDGWNSLRRSEALPRRSLPHAAEPHLSRRDHPQRQCLSGRAPSDRRPSALGSSSGNHLPRIASIERPGHTQSSQASSLGSPLTRLASG